jgi:hypothetical protein
MLMNTFLEKLAQSEIGVAAIIRHSYGSERSGNGNAS